MSDDAKARSSAAQSERWLAVCRHCSLRVDIPLSRHEPCSNGALHDWMRVKDEARSASPTPSVALRPHITACLDCISRDGRAWEPGAKMRGVACVGCGAGSWEREDVQRWTLADHGAARPTSPSSATSRAQAEEWLRSFPIVVDPTIVPTRSGREIPVTALAALLATVRAEGEAKGRASANEAHWMPLFDAAEEVLRYLDRQAKLRGVADTVDSSHDALRQALKDLLEPLRPEQKRST